jgi:hypothetical protein
MILPIIAEFRDNGPIPEKLKKRFLKYVDFF